MVGFGGSAFLSLCGGVSLVVSFGGDRLHSVSLVVTIRHYCLFGGELGGDYLHSGSFGGELWW